MYSKVYKTNFNPHSSKVRLLVSDFKPGDVATWIFAKVTFKLFFWNFTNFIVRAREFCINSIEEYEEKVKEIEELKKAQAQEEEGAEEDPEEGTEDNEEVSEGGEQGKVEKLEGEPEEKKPKTSSSNASTLSIELKEKQSIRKVFFRLSCSGSTDGCAHCWGRKLSMVVSWTHWKN